MKTIVAFIDPVKTMIEKEFDYDGITRACQGAMNDPQTVQVKEGKVARGSVKGGQSWKKDGSLSVKNLSWTERLNLDYETKYTAPVEAVKWHDSLVNHFNKAGLPSGELTVDLVPRHVREWFGKFPLKLKETDDERKEREKTEAKAANEETRRLVEAGEIPAPAKENGKGKGKRATTPANATA